MSDQFFIVNLLATGGATVVQEDQLPGLNWIVIEGSFNIPCEIDLSYEFADGVTQSSSGIYWIRTDGGNLLGSRLIVTDLCENAQGSDGEDFIQGNEASNIIKGDSNREGPGLTSQDDTLWGGGAGDTIYGGEGADGITGDEGRDLLFGDAGFDLIQGGSDIDTIEGGLGADQLSGGADLGDVVSYRESTGGVIIDITFGVTTTGIGGHAEDDKINGFTDVWGSDWNDVISDTNAGTIAFRNNDNRFQGWDGDDVLILGGGNDTGNGGIGEDRIYGGTGRDKLYGGDDIDRLNGGDRNDTLEGGALGDMLRGGNGNDRLDGGAGWDDLYGGRGRDTLIGGAGSDEFLYFARTDSGPTALERDTILDFDRNRDFISVSAIDAIAGTAADDAFTFMGHLAFDGAGQVRLQDVTDGILVLFNLDADLQAEMSIFLQDTFLIEENNFTL